MEGYIYTILYRNILKRIHVILFLRCNPILLSPRNMWLISYNWRYGRYDNKTLLLNKVKVMPWLQMTNDTLWWSGGNHLYGVKHSSKHFKEKVNIEINYSNRFYNNIYVADICKFVLCGNFIISGHRCVSSYKYCSNFVFFYNKILCKNFS